MDRRVPEGPNARFTSRDVAQAAFADETAADLAANAADITLLIDESGVIRDAAFPGEEFADDDFKSWIGQRWTDLVHPDSREKVAELLAGGHTPGERRWRHINHAQADGPILPVRFFTLPASRKGWVLAIGRDLCAASRLQQRLIDAQRSMEREYGRVRQAETRFRLLFSLTDEGVLIIEDGGLRISDANPAAARLLDRPSDKIEGRTIDSVMGTAPARTLSELLAVTRRTGQAETGRLALEGRSEPVTVTASPYKEGSRVFFLVRMDDGAERRAGEDGARMSRVVELLPDALIVINEAGEILSANSAFGDLADLPNARSAVGLPLGQFLGRTETELNVLLANLREHGAVRNYSTSVQTRSGLREPVEVSAVAAPAPSGSVFGFSIRTTGLRMPDQPAASAAPGKGVDHLSDLVGRLALKDIVRESTDMIERACIEAALELTNNNRASAAELLGLSRQSLYAKMHRHNVGA